MTEERMLSRIKKLLDRAAHPGTPAPEAESCLATADAMMTKYAIDEAMLNAARSPEERLRPERRDLTLFEPYGPLRGSLDTIMRQLAELCDVAVARIGGGKHAVVGFTADIDYFEMLFMSVRLTFQSRMFPRWDPTADTDLNVYSFKLAGYKWLDIYKAAHDAGTRLGYSAPPNDGGAMIRAYKRHAKRVGDTRQIRTQRFDAYRESYKSGFVNTIAERVYTQRKDRANAESASGSGAELVLRDKRADVLEAFYVDFPSHRPISDEEAERQMAEWRAERAAEEAAEAERRAALTDEQRDLEDRMRERKEAEDQRRWAAYDAKNRSDRDGYAAGSAAAQSLDLSGGRNNLSSTTKELK